MAAKLVSRAFGHTLVQWRSDIENEVIVKDSEETQYGFSWEWFCEFVLENGFESLSTHPISKRDIVLDGYFQQSKIYLANRDWLRSLFTSDNTDHLSLDIRVCDLMNTVPRNQKENTITVHLRMGDFQSGPGNSFILHPTVYLEKLRKLMPSPIEIITQAPEKKEEEFYLALFDCLGAYRCEASSALEDHATLRCAKRAFFSNSTFAWTAAFLGDAEERYIPLIDCFSNTQNLGPISEKDTLLESKFICLETLSVPKYPKPFSGENIQGLCDSIIIDKEKEDYHRYLDKFISREKWLFLETESWPIQKNVEIVCLYAEKVPESCARIVREIFPDLRVLLIHNGDTTPCEKSLLSVLERFEDLEIFAQNNVFKHTRVHSLPMGIQNTMWRDFELENSQHVEKQYFGFSSHFANTHPVRKELVSWLSSHRFQGLYVNKKCTQDIYWKTVYQSHFTFCPPGNAHDTHRLWESLFFGSIPVVLRTEFIDRLVETFPGLPMIILDSYFIEDYETLLMKHVGMYKKIPFCLYIEFWKVLFDTYRKKN